MKVVVLDGYTLNPGDLTWEPLKEFGEVTVYDRTSYVEDPLIVERIGDAEIIVINKTPISKATLDACPNLKAIAVVATGYNVVDYEYAKKKRVPVFNVPGYGTQIVAQYTVGLLLEICSHFQYHSDTVHGGKWQNSPDFCYWDHPMIELDGKTAGIIGLGRIGRATAKILGAMGMRVITFGSRECEEGKALAEYTDLDTLLRESDVILLHCPLFPETQGIINKDNIAKMKDGVILINSGRGQLIVEEDLADALNSGKIYAAGLDVVSTEPIQADNPLLQAKNCLITPHIAWAAKEARQRILSTTVENIRNYLNGQMTNVVNMWNEEEDMETKTHYIENEALKIGINEHGAELVSLVAKETEREYMWSGDAKYWNRVSPVLFPFVGKLVEQTYRHDGKSYPGVPQHGYARDSEFELASVHEDEIWFQLRPDDLWKERYPFDFTLRIGYRLEGKMVHVMWTVINNSPENMSFSIGAHPAFIMPDGDSKNGYYLDLHMESKELVCGELNENGLLKPLTRSYDLEEGKLKLSDELFDKDALIIDSDEIHCVSILTPEGQPFLQVRFDTPQLGIWSPAGKKAPFVCIEPWYGRSDRVTFKGSLSEREYGNTIEPGHSFNKEYVIEIV